MREEAVGTGFLQQAPNKHTVLPRRGALELHGYERIAKMFHGLRCRRSEWLEIVTLPAGARTRWFRESEAEGARVTARRRADALIGCLGGGGLRPGLRQWRVQ